MEAFMWRFHPMHRRARELARIRRDWKRSVPALRVHLYAGAADERSARQRRWRGGGIMDVGCYCISAARFFFDAEPVRAYVRADFDPEYDVDMLAAGLLEFPGKYATFDAGFALPYRCDYELVGESGPHRLQRTLSFPAAKSRNSTSTQMRQVGKWKPSSR